MRIIIINIIQRQRCTSLFTQISVHRKARCDGILTNREKDWNNNTEGYPGWQAFVHVYHHNMEVREYIGIHKTIVWFAS